MQNPREANNCTFKCKADSYMLSRTNCRFRARQKRAEENWSYLEKRLQHAYGEVTCYAVELKRDTASPEEIENLMLLHKNALMLHASLQDRKEKLKAMMQENVSKMEKLKAQPHQCTCYLASQE